MADINKLIKAWVTFRDSNPYGLCFGREFRAIREPEYCMGQMIADTIDLLKSQQAESARPRPKKGQWEMKEDPFGFFDEIPVCSVCGRANAMRKKTAYCEHCGADMREGDVDGKA